MQDAPEPRHAASLLVIRTPRAGPPEILMARRAAGHRFMPNMLVFPGGAVDAADFHTVPATPLAPGVLARLQRSADIHLAGALGIAAAREMQEEVGLSLGMPPALAGLDYLCRAITPPDRAVRFDARFFVVDASLTTGVPTGSAELEAPAWYTIEAALRADTPAATKAVLARLALRLAGDWGDDAVAVLRNRAWETE